MRLFQPAAGITALLLAGCGAEPGNRLTTGYLSATAATYVSHAGRVPTRQKTLHYRMLLPGTYAFAGMAGERVLETHEAAFRSKDFLEHQTFAWETERVEITYTSGGKAQSASLAFPE